MQNGKGLGAENWEREMTISDEMRVRLQAAFAPKTLKIEDDSASHAGHAGNPGGAGETHFNVMIRSEAFAGQSRVARHRMVHKALGDLVPRIHALALDLDV
ncbi:BolA protein [Celeribacter baekdonensis B30]|uniref:BolA protein n=2 Tax=Rhodobacterales TaxID=204455 RepID=K2JS56_9RHOB|nr:BolA protein [Celeribacter baekdonensis B30]|tara:strand:- start:18843 stop:19145 length:303 start_codon:yes stop_codon:yes gene_type:complete